MKCFIKPPFLNEALFFPAKWPFFMDLKVKSRESTSWSVVSLATDAWKVTSPGSRTGEVKERQNGQVMKPFDTLFCRENDKFKRFQITDNNYC